MAWNGTDWTVLSMPVPDSSSGLPSVALNDVHAFAPDDVWAVGSNQGPDSAAQETLAYHWDGSQWHVVPSAAGRAGAYGSEFYCVDGVSGDDFWAVGYLNDSGAPNASTLAAHWNGSSWEEHILPSLGNANIPALKDLHVRASDDIWALEGIGLGPPVSPRRIFHWDGSAWSEGADRLDPLRYGAAEAIHSFGPDDVWVSSVLDSSFQIVMLHWDGSTWTEMNVPVFAYAFFGDAPDDFFAVGYASIMHWDGSTWSVVATLPDLAQANCFDAELAADGALWCAGTTQPGRASGTLTARLTRCSTGFRSFCDAADGTLGACPCANAGNPNSGCDNAQATGGVSLAILGQSTAPNGATLQGLGFSTMGNATAIVLRSTSLDPARPVTFGDGLRCISTTPLVRMAATLSEAGASTHAITHGAAAGPGTFYYQIWYRNTPSSFCTPDAYNMSNGNQLVW